MPVIGYARVSTTGQKLEVQLQALSDCDLIFQEKLSGANKKRPELTRLLNTVTAGDTVKVTKLCRLARNTRHLLEIVEFLDEKQVSLQVMNLGIDTSTSTGRLMLTIIGGVAAFERQLLLERQAEGIKLAKQQGKYLGRKPTAKSQSDDVIALLDKGHSKQVVAQQLNISVSSVYRIINNRKNK